MLTVTRKTNERIMVGDDIVVEVRKIDQSYATLKISSSAPVPMKREEAVGKPAVAGLIVVSRAVGQRVLIGDDVVVEVRHVEPGRAKVGIEAPRHMLLLREELLSRART